MNPSIPDGNPPQRRVLPLALAGFPEGDLAAYFEGLANPTRLRIVQRLAEVKEARVSDVALLLGISQPRMSWHLRLLRRARIVTTRRDGREVFCRLDRDSIQASFQRFSRLVEERPAPRSTASAGAESASTEIASQPRAHSVAERSLPEVVR
ncbi:MAG TPA: metalloregulator ArsR/SmtB family transcription factor [Candidatus Micrarchaeaceae archaeon]|nr:metalloregulator ArsR/SmtB family transcription factor [Candidatus Micrarchaeaceae archaeon]